MKLLATLLLLGLPVVPVQAAEAGNTIVTEWCEPAPCMEPNAVPTRGQWVDGVTRLHPRISAGQASMIWDLPNKWWRNHIPWQRRTTNWSTFNPATTTAAGGYCMVTTRNSARNLFGERGFAVYHHKEWHGDDTWDVDHVSYNTWVEIKEVGQAYHLSHWAVVDDWWSTRGGTGSLHSFHGSRRTGVFKSILIPFLGFEISTTLDTYMGAYYNRTVETGNNGRQSCYTID